MFRKAGGRVDYIYLATLVAPVSDPSLKVVVRGEGRRGRQQSVGGCDEKCRGCLG